jgi:hypothetical protein
MRAPYTIIVEAPGRRARVVCESADLGAHMVHFLGACTEHQAPGARLWVLSPSAFVETQVTRWTFEGNGWRRVEAFETPFSKAAA